MNDIYELWDAETSNLLMDGTLQEIVEFIWDYAQANPTRSIGGLTIVPPHEVKE